MLRDFYDYLLYNRIFNIFFVIRFSPYNYDKYKLEIYKIII